MERSPILNTRPAVPGEPIAAHDVRGGGGLRLHVREWGDRDGPPILLIHGWSQSQLCWARQVSGKLIEGFRIVTFDNRGHGMSEKPTDAGHYVDARVWADDVAAVIDQTGLDRPVLVGWSYGGFIATDYVRVYGEQRIASRTWEVKQYVRQVRARRICVYDGPDPESIRKAATHNGLPVDAIREVCVLDPYFY